MKDQWSENHFEIQVLKLLTPSKGDTLNSQNKKDRLQTSCFPWFAPWNLHPIFLIVGRSCIAASQVQTEITFRNSSLTF